MVMACMEPRWGALLTRADRRRTSIRVFACEANTVEDAGRPAWVLVDACSFKACNSVAKLNL